jgi:hypothetical protein
MSARRRSNPSERDLAAFADGSLPAARRAEIEEALAASPQLRAAVADQQQVLGAIDAASRERAPSSLRARVSLAQPPPRRRGAHRAGALAGAALATCAVLIAVAIVTVGGGAVAPTVAQASVLVGRAPQQGVMEPVADHETLPGVTAAGLTYPYWEDQFDYRATGVRHDGFSGRRVTTVFYSHGASRVAYEIVSGAPLRMGGKVLASTQRDGVRLWAMQSPHGLVVTWLRHGHTCILIGAHTGLPALLRLAAWHQGGRVPY